MLGVHSIEGFGQFVFSKAVLSEKRILSKQEKDRKRAIRVYPPWEIAENLQAKKSLAIHIFSRNRSG